MSERIAPLSRPVHVLLAEDNPVLCTVLADGMRDLGYTVDTVHSGDDLCRMLGLGPASADGVGKEHWPDVILADIFLPGQTGLALAGLIHEADLRIPVVLMTGSAADEWRRASAAVAVGVLQKPFDLDQLDTVLRAAIGTGRVEAPAGRAATNDGEGRK